MSSRSLVSGAFIRFVLLSGCGWLLDLATLLTLTQAMGAPPFVGNLVSSLLAASLVFLVSRQRIHAGGDGGMLVGLSLYLVYTLIVILLASAAMPFLVSLLAGRIGLGESRAIAVLMAKVIITPPQLLCNFIVSRHLAGRTSPVRT